MNSALTQRLFAATVSLGLYAAPLSASPVWIASEGESIAEPLVGTGSARVAWLGDRAAVVSASFNERGVVATLVDGMDGPPLRGQFGARQSRLLAVDRVLATLPDGMLLSGRERIGDPFVERAFVAYVSDQGRLLWAHPGAASDGLLRDGVAVVRSGSILRAFDTASGELRWSRALNDLLPTVSNTFVKLASTPSYPLLAQVSHTDPVQQRTSPFVLNIDLSTGELVWQWRLPAGPGYSAAVCGMAEVNGDLVLPWRMLNTTDFLVERRRGDGSVVWASTLVDVAYSGNHACALVANADRVALATNDLSNTETIGLTAATGQLSWRQIRLGGGAPRLLDLASDDLLFLPAPSGPTRIVQRLNASTGSVVWEATLPNDGAIAVRQDAAVIALASYDSSVPALLQRYLDPADGQILSQGSEVLTIQRTLPSAASFVAGVPYLVGAGQGPERRNIQLRRLDPLSGVLQWEQTYLLPEAAASVGSVSLQSDGVDGVLLGVHYTPQNSSSGPERWLLMRVDAAGSAVFQRLFTQTPSASTASFRAHPNAELTLSVDECTNPPGCSSSERSIVRIDGLGQERWRRSVISTLIGPVGQSILYLDRTSFAIPLIGADGLERWQRPGTSGTIPEAVLDLNTSVAYAETRITSSSSEWELFSLDPDTGAVLWSDLPPAPFANYRIVQGVPYLAPDGSSLVTPLRTSLPGNELERIDSPLLLKHQIGNGQRLAYHAPSGGVDRYWTLGGMLGSTPGPLWMRGTRYLDGFGGREQLRFSVARIDVDTLEVLADYQLLRDLDRPVQDTGSFRPVALADNGQIMIESWGSEVDGVHRYQLRSLPAVSDSVVDLQVTLDDQSPLTALGPSRMVQVRVSNPGDAAQQAQIESVSPSGQAWAILRGCVLQGGGQCPPLSTSGRRSFDLDSNAEMILSFEVFGQSFVPSRQPDTPDIVWFVVEAAAGVGDRDLGDNLVAALVSLGGFGNGFE